MNRLLFGTGVGLVSLAAALFYVAPAPRVEAATTDVSIVDFAFSSASITVATGDTVHWTNTGAASHTVTSETSAFDSGILASGAEFSHTFSAPGTYAYVCGIHPSMTGTVNVQDAPTSTATTGASATATRTRTPSTTPTGTPTPGATTPVVTPSVAATPAAGETPSLIAPAGQPGAGGAGPIGAPSAGAGPSSEGGHLGALSAVIGALGVALTAAGVVRRRRVS